MSNTRFGLTNRLFSTVAVLKNGTGGGAPALIESPPYTMSNLLNGDRSSLWKTSVLSSGTTYNVDFDLGATVSFAAAALLGYRLAVGVGPLVDVFYQTGAYTPGGSWTSWGSISGLSNNPRDVGITGNSVNARSVRFAISPVAASESFSLGGFFVGGLSDLGGIYSRGGAHVPFQNRLETPLANGAVVLTRIGDNGHTWTMPWNAIPAATRSILSQAQAKLASFVLVDSDDRFFEVFMRGGSLSESVLTPDLHDITLELASMP